MSISKQSQDDDFWDDCITDDINITNIDNIPININNRKHSKNNRRNQKLLTKNLTATKSNKLITEALTIEENIKKSNKKRRHDSIEHMLSLYNQAMQSKEAKNKSIIQRKENKKKIEIESCSFKPKYFRNKSLQNKIKKEFGQTTIYERGVKYQEKVLIKVAKIFEEENKRNNTLYRFYPEITSKNLNHVFNSNNFCKEQTRNDSNKIFLFRLMKAREEEEYKKYLRDSNIRTNLKIDWNCPRNLKRSISQKDSIIIQSNLHNKLFEN
jgi:hypothetical protein